MRCVSNCLIRVDRTVLLTRNPSRGVEGPGPATLRQPTFGHGANARFDEEVTIMVSKAIASLDAWLARAEKVLAEQREHALSPSLGLLAGDGKQEWTITLAELSEGLEELLGSLCRRPGRWILIVEDDARHDMFWQALAFEDGSLCTEVTSKHYHWSRDQENQLLALGWDAPNPPRRPNFIHVEYTTSPEIDVEFRRALATLSELFGLRDYDQVVVKMFSSSIRGDTPASSQYTTEERM